MFRADRIDALAELDEPAAPPPQARPHDLSDGVFRPAPDLPLVTLRVGRGSRWITEYYPCEGVAPRRRASGWSRCGSPTWAGPGGWCSASGPDVTVVAPPELVERVARRGRRAALRRVRRRRSPAAADARQDRP